MTATTAVETGQLTGGGTPRPAGTLLRAALRLRRTQLGLGLVLLLVAIALVGPLVSPHGPTEFVGAPSTPPSADAIFGTDYLGQDVLARFLHGGRSVLLLATLSTGLGALLGIVVGLTAAYNRRLLDELLMRAMDVIFAFPQILLSLLVLAMFGAAKWLLVLVVAFTTMPRVARVVRGAAAPFADREFMLAAEAIGESRVRLLFAELLPNIISPLAVETTLRLTYTIAIVAGLSFLGFTTSPNGADWGQMIQENQVALTVQPWGVLLPVIAIALLTIGTSIVGDGLARAAIGVERNTGAR